MATKKRYTEEYRADVVALVNKGDRTLRQVAEDLDLNRWTLVDWVRAEKMKKTKRKPVSLASSLVEAEETTEEQNARLLRELKEARKQIAQLEEDRVILKKAAAFFARENE
jgi:transposase-like protein